jgi:hypothetical protein
MDEFYLLGCDPRQTALRPDAGLHIKSQWGLLELNHSLWPLY